MLSLTVLRLTAALILMLCVALAGQSKLAPKVTDLQHLYSHRTEIVDPKTGDMFSWAELSIASGKIDGEDGYRIECSFERYHFRELRVERVRWTSVRTSDLKLIYHHASRQVGSKKSLSEIICDDSGYVTVIKDKKRKRGKIEHRPDAQLVVQIMVNGVEPLTEEKGLVFRSVDTDTLELHAQRCRYLGKERVSVNGTSVLADAFESSYLKDKGIKTYVDSSGDILRVDHQEKFSAITTTKDVAALKAKLRALPAFWNVFSSKMRKGWRSKGQAISHELAALKMRLPKGFKRRKLTKEDSSAIVLDLYGGKDKFVYQILLGIHFDDKSLRDCADEYAKSRESEEGFVVDALEEDKCAGRPAVRLDYRAEHKGRSGCYSMWFVTDDGLLYRFLVGADGVQRNTPVIKKLKSMQRGLKITRR